MTLPPTPDGSAPGAGGQTAAPPPEIPEFRDVEQLQDGSWRAVHKRSGEIIAADTFERLERIEAPMVRISHAWQENRFSPGMQLAVATHHDPTHPRPDRYPHAPTGEQS